jgi:hypothetical protein
MSRILFFMFLIPFGSFAQFTYVLDQTVPVKDITGTTLVAPWAGGLNAAQYNTLDLNHDDQEDLVLFDRMANKVITFINNGNSWQYAPEYESLFPADVTNWLLLRDFNCDGRKDIFTADVLGIKVFLNNTKDGESLSWQQHLFNTSGTGPKSEVLLTKGFSGLINLQLQFDDIPAIIDADGDGDLDIFNVRFVGNGTVEYHQNFGMERYGTCDSLIFERQTQIWGNFRECLCGVFALNGTDCPPPPGGRVKHAGGKALLALDANGDGNLDLLFSEATCSQLYLLPNTGTVNTPVINTFAVFPPTVPANFPIFPAAFYEDLDFDGKKDLIAIPNVYSKQVLETDLAHSNWFYKNTGSNASPSFQFVKNNFLQDQMIDVGDNAVPAFADYDGDNDLDLFISRNASQNYTSTIFLYQNTGTPAAPEFTLIDNDYLKFSTTLFYNVKISFADMDHDNTNDLVFTATGLATGITTLNYLQNKNTSGLNFSGQGIQTINFNLTSTENLSPVDVDQDGFVDILAGRSNGALEFWKNTTAHGVPSFMLEDDSFVDIGSSVLRQNISVASGDLNADGKADLVLGDQGGITRIVSDYRDQKTQLSEIVFNPLTNAYYEQNLGGRLWPVIANIYNTDKPAIVGGNILGGIRILKNDGGESRSGSPEVTVYPNPVSHAEPVNIKVNAPATMQVLDILGKRLGEPVKFQANIMNQYQPGAMAAGVYLLRFSSGGKTAVMRLIVY